MSSSDTSASVRLTGRVKWFNNKTGFGFITIVGGNDQFKDASEIFAHHSAIKVSQEQYRYLVEGEYVEFSVSSTASGDHKFQAADVRGVKGGKLFCETRNEQRASASASAPAASSGDRDDRPARPLRGARSSSGGRGRGGGGRSRGRGDWMLVRRDAPESKDSSNSRGSGRVYSSRASGPRQQLSESSLSESVVEHAQPMSAPPPTPTPTPVTSTEPNEVSATPRASSARKPKQSKPSS
jgi:CspA family cold shock protein